MAEADEPARLVGVLDVLVHEARDIRNICIYHKQDVYAKLRLTADAPGSAVSTRTVNGGGRNPVFNQSLRLGVARAAAGPPPASVRCEVWMLSRVRSFLEDQLLGFAVVPLSDVVAAGGRLAGEFPLSSTDLSRSPSGFVRLSVEYTGSSLHPELVSPPAATTVLEESSSSVVPCEEMSRIEFPDLKVASENRMMAAEYLGIPCSSSMDAPEDDDDDCPNHQAGVRVVESFTAVTARPDDPAEVPKAIIGIDVEPQRPVVQQDIVDMYMRSMQQFAESLANMKLPMDVGNNRNGDDDNGDSSGSGGGGSSGNVDTANGGSGADRKLPAAAKKNNSRVFYGSRAFF